ncbi:unnamed protein product, partial [Meganyctiphanes norvegica]
REDRTALALVICNLVDNMWCCNPWLGATDGSGLEGSSLMVPGKDLGHTAIGHLKDPRYITGADTGVGHLDDLVSDVVRQGTPVDIDTSHLIHTRAALLVKSNVGLWLDLS